MTKQKTKANLKYINNHRKKSDIKIEYSDGTRYSIKNLSALIVDSINQQIFIEAQESTLSFGISTLQVSKLHLGLVFMLILKTPEGIVKITRQRNGELLISSGNYTSICKSFVYNKDK